MKKIVGILGGMGPLATVKLFEKIVLLTDAKSDQEHLQIIIDSNTSIPDRTSYILDEKARDPKPQLLESALRLERAGADFIIMPCNTAHNFYDYIKENINIPFLNMIEETAKTIRNKYPSIEKVGLLATDGTIKARVYDRVFEEYGMKVVKPTGDNQKSVYDLIYNIKEGINQEDLGDFYKAMDEIKDQGVDLFIAGCTEISVALDLYQLQGNFIDPMDAVAISAIKYAGGKVKDI